MLLYFIFYYFFVIPRPSQKEQERICLPKQGSSCQAHCWPHTCNPDVSYGSSSEHPVQRRQLCCQWSCRRALEAAVALTPSGLQLPPSCIAEQPVSRLGSCRLEFYTTSQMKTWDSFSDLHDGSDRHQVKEEPGLRRESGVNECKNN